MENQITILSEEDLKSKIYTVRGVQVMLDADLAEIYGYTTSRFNEQVKNNIERFDEDFMFQLTEQEFKGISNLMSKISTSSWGGTRKLPRAFTEQGVYMLMTVLKGDLAVKQSKALVRIFKQMKDFIVDNQSVLDRRDYLRLSLQTAENTRDMLEIRQSLSELDDKVAEVVDKLGECVTKSELSTILLDFSKPVTKIGWLILDGQPVESDIAYHDIYAGARKSIFVIDNYISLKTLLLLRHAKKGVAVTVFSDNANGGLRKAEYDDFEKEYFPVSLKKSLGKFHDRYIVIDWGENTEKIYHCGSSSKDGGRRVTTITRLEDTAAYRPLVEKVLGNGTLVLK